ncbi:transposase [Nocardia sp. NPDC052278]|uniref:transposase n=1 Tax=unclassified Nocardia TaxID=2637762 RepID=UPI00368D81D2
MESGHGGRCGCWSRFRVLTDQRWELLEQLLPRSLGRVGRDYANNRRVVEGMLYRLRSGVPGRDLA